jgi:hypothetical protein
MIARDFRLIADVISGLYVGTAESERAREAAASAFADRLARENPRFKRAQFLAACGVLVHPRRLLIVEEVPPGEGTVQEEFYRTLTGSPSVRRMRFVDEPGPKADPGYHVTPADYGDREADDDA